MSTPDNKDRQINPYATAGLLSEGPFYVSNLLKQPYGGPDWRHTVTAECSYCHRSLQVSFHAPWNISQFVKNEACRLAVLEHLRTEHPTPKKQQT